MLVEEKAAPFNLIYFFKGDSVAHHEGLGAQRRYLQTADGYVGRIFAAGAAQTRYWKTTRCSPSRTTATTRSYRGGGTSTCTVSR